MRVAVVGAGLFGCTAAIYAKRAGHHVELYDWRSDIMQGASGRCYYRLHRGYHYPRSPETARESLRAEASFLQEYGPAVIHDGTQFYAIADGKITERQFVLFMERMGLPYLRCASSVIDLPDVFEVSEPRIDGQVLTELVRDKLSGIPLKLGRYFQDMNDYDAVVLAGYADTNATMTNLGLPTRDYKFQIVEKPIVRMPREFAGVSIMVVDGPFGCLDPHGDGLHVLGHVTETIHHANIGREPQIPIEYSGLLRWIGCDVPKITRLPQVVEALSQFIPDVRKAEHVASVFTVRAVIPDDNDARPTLVDCVSDKVIRIFSGKLGTAVSAARETVAMLAAMDSLYVPEGAVLNVDASFEFPAGIGFR